jgi:catechol 2,3-dioxygenase-like lactoylglutathione lyase family enzyme
MIEKISAVTLWVANMRASVRFYKDVLGLEIIYGSGYEPGLCHGRDRTLSSGQDRLR